MPFGSGSETKTEALFPESIHNIKKKKDKKNVHVYKSKYIDASLVRTLVLLDGPLGSDINLILLKEL